MHAAPPSVAQAWASFVLLLVALVAVVGLAKVLSPSIEAAARMHRARHQTVIGIVIAAAGAAARDLGWQVRAAQVNRLQTSSNLAYGSALASIGLTIPVVAVASVWMGLPLVLGLDAKDLVLLMLTFVVSAITPHLRPHAHDARRGAPGDLRGVRVSSAGAVVERHCPIECR